MKRCRVIIGSDHGGFELKQGLVSYLEKKGCDISDFGCHSEDPVDYADVASLVAQAVAHDVSHSVGILIDGAGSASCICANKVPGIRAAACYDTFTAKNSRRHNNANVLTLGSRVTGIELAKEIVDSWLESEFEGGRHQRRVEKIYTIERKFFKQDVL